MHCHAHCQHIAVMVISLVSGQLVIVVIVVACMGVYMVLCLRS